MKIKDFEKSGRPKNRYSKTIKILLGVFALLIAGVAVSGYLLYDFWHSSTGESLKQPKVEIVKATPTPVPVETAVGQTPPPSLETTEPVPTETLPPGSIEYNGVTYIKNEDVINILFLGIDTNTERKIARAGYRSDMVMVCAIDTVAHKATLISIPRDTYTTVYKIDENTGAVTETLQQKVNTAYSYGGGATKYSYPNAMACVELFLSRTCQLEQPLDFTLDVPVNLYAGIDMDGIQHIAAAVGGVQVTLERGIAGVGSKGQTVTLKYANAELYLRTRHDAGGDLDRVRRQQKFMIALAKKIKERGQEDIIGTVLALWDDVQRYVFTNLTTDQMVDLAKILVQTNIDEIELITVPGESAKRNGSYVILHDEAATLDILLSVYYKELPN